MARVLTGPTNLPTQTRKRRFQFVFWCVMAVNCSSLYWLTFTEDAEDMRLLLGFGQQTVSFEGLWRRFGL